MESEIQKITPNEHSTQVVQNSKSNNKKPNPLEVIFLSDKNQFAEKNTRSGLTGKFQNVKTPKKQIDLTPGFSPTGILTKGSEQKEVKGKGLSANDDFIAGATIGPMTILNTQEYRYFNFYQRIRDKVTDPWRTAIRTQILKEKTKKPLEIGLWTTKLLITLDSSGKVISLGVVQSSGYDTFDKVAKDAFLTADKFPLPPKDLVKDGQCQIRWDFTVMVEKASKVDFKSTQY